MAGPTSNIPAPDLPDAACASYGDPEWWYAAEATYPRIEDITAAKLVCWKQCSERSACLSWAVEHDEAFGIWGGYTAQERKQLIKESNGARLCGEVSDLSAT
jgi:WhiB family redox-sensing transcriptional regulator